MLNQLPEYYESSRENKGGEIKGDTKITRRLLYQVAYHKEELSQEVFYWFSKKELDMILENLTSFNGLFIHDFWNDKSTIHIP